MCAKEALLPRVSVVVPCFNAERTVAKCIEACLRQDYSNLEIIFVDDGSNDATPTILGAYNGIKVLTQPNSGAASARNFGWRSSSGQIVCFTDSDCVPNPRWVSRLVEGYSAPVVGGIGGSYDIANPESWLARCIHEEIRERHLRMPRQVNYLGSFNVSYRRSVLEQAGGFDEGFRRASGEDNDLSYQVLKLGYTLLFDPDNCVAHHHTEGFWRYMRQQFWHGYWRIRLYNRHPDTLGGDHYVGLFELLQLPLSLLAGLVWLLSWADKIVLLLALVLSALVVGGQAPMALAIVRRTGDINYSLFALVMVVRAFARGLGMARALLSSSLAEILSLVAAFLRIVARRRSSRAESSRHSYRRASEQLSVDGRGGRVQ
jgi:glycosyltransferase involved in cell wall biosynthesis